MMLIDAHAHWSDHLLNYPKIAMLINCATPEEFHRIKQLQLKYPNVYYSCGLHPWDVETLCYEDMLPYLEQSQIIGEIGMDNVWCKTDENLQYEVFNAQLQYAYAHKKPVVLHTKGKEKEIAAMIAQYPNTYIVHWYSSLEDVEAYMALDCYFTVGPSIDTDESVRQVVQKVGLDRLLIESDGISAIEWAIHRKLEHGEYEKILQHSIDEIAAIKHRTPQSVEHHITENFHKILQSI